MATIAVLPIKSFAAAKQRLQEELSTGYRRALAEAMFSDVLVALKRATTIEQILVVTADSTAQQIAGGYGAGVLDDLDRGHNFAATRGVRAALRAGADRVLLVPGDCPTLDQAEVDSLMNKTPARARSAFIVPDRHGTGTNALLLTPPDALEPSFGPGSCQRHLNQARAHGLLAEVAHVPSLALDVDTPDDLAALQATLETIHGRAARTRGMLRQLERSRV